MSTSTFEQLNLKEQTAWSSQVWEFLLSLLVEGEDENVAQRDVVNPLSPSELDDLESDGVVTPATGPRGYELTEAGAEEILWRLVLIPSRILLGREKAIAGREPFAIARQVLGPTLLQRNGITNDDKMIEWLKKTKEEQRKKGIRMSE